mmetsp:Transcript_86010/g.230076  ORF Transcript_86010/g.230076 Transcript_86010/m.230076 type:complete len:239 (+) Transcript_86010:1473-2189(+)
MESQLHPQHVLQHSTPDPAGHPLPQDPHTPVLQHPPDHRQQRQPHEKQAGILRSQQRRQLVRVEHVLHCLHHPDPLRRLLAPEGERADHGGDGEDPLGAAEIGQAEQGGLVGLGDLSFPGLLCGLLLGGGVHGGVLLGGTLAAAASLALRGILRSSPGRSRRVGLGGHKSVVLPLLLHERLVGAGLHHVPPLQHKDLIALTYGGQAVGDGDGGDLVFTPRIQRVQGGLDHFLALLIQG